MQYYPNHIYSITLCLSDTFFPAHARLRLSFYTPQTIVESTLIELHLTAVLKT